MKVLITDADLRSSLPITRALGLKGIDVTLAAHREDTMAFFSKFCTKKLIVPRLDPKEKYIAFLLNEVKNEKYDLLITLSDQTTEYLSECRAQFEPYVQLAIPRHDILLQCLNKDIFYRFAKNKNIPIPETFFLSDLQELDQLPAPLQFPVVVKYPRGGGGDNNFYCNSLSEIKKAFKNLSAANPACDYIPVIQEFVQGKRFGCDVLCDHGKIVAYFQFEALRENPSTGGNTIKARSVHIEKLNAVAEQAVSGLAYHGIANMDFILDNRSNEFKLLEINPRFGGPIHMAISAGIDFPNLLFKMAVKHEQIGNKAYANNLVFKPIFSGSIFRNHEIKYARKHKSRIPILMLEFLNPWIKKDFVLSDPGPYVMLIKTITQHFRKRFGFSNT
jgi:predicted ATP-grasp superfamily ATP-dependent carboligase